MPKNEDVVFDPAQMDRAANDAERELVRNPRWSTIQVAQWWLRWYMKAGHKRLGRLLVKLGRATGGKE